MSSAWMAAGWSSMDNCLRRMLLARSGYHCSLGRPNSCRDAITRFVGRGNTKTLILVASGDHITVLDPNFHLITTLPFHDAFPSAKLRDWRITALHADPANERIFAACANQIAVWQLDGQSHWKVVASFASSYPVTSIDTYRESLILAGNAGLTLSQNDASSRFALWHTQDTVSMKEGCDLVKFSPCGNFIAAFAPESDVVVLFRIIDAALHKISSIWHPSKLDNLEWLNTDPDHPALITYTSNMVTRIWALASRSKHQFVLWATIHLSTDSVVLATVALPSTSEQGSSDDCQFLSITADGALYVTTINNISKIPSMCLTQTTAKLSRVSVAKSSFPTLRHVFPVYAADQLVLVGRSAKGAMSKIQIDQSSLRPSLLQDQKPLLSGRQIRPPADQNIKSLSRSADLRYISSVGQQGQLTLWRTKVLCGHTHEFESIASQDLPLRPFHTIPLQDGKRVLLADAEGNLDILSLLKRKLVKQSDQSTYTFQTPLLAIHAVQCLDNEDDYVLVAVTRDGFISSFRLSSNGSFQCLSEPSPLLNQPPKLASIASLPSGGPASMTVLVAEENGDLSSWRMHNEKNEWDKTGHTSTLRQNIRLVKGYASMHCATVSVDQDGSDELAIWDLRQTEFSSGQEYSWKAGEDLVDLHWTLASEGLPLLAVVLETKIQILHRHRLDYFGDGALWSAIWSVDLSSVTPYPLSAAMWLPGPSLAVSSSNQLFLYTISSSKNSLLQAGKRAISPLPDYHPQLLFLYALSGKPFMVFDILARLLKAMRFDKLDVNEFRTTEISETLSTATKREEADNVFSALTNGYKPVDDNGINLSAEDCDDLLERLKEVTLPELDAGEMEQLQLTIRSIFEARSQIRSLDANGLRYLVSTRIFFNKPNQKSTPYRPLARLAYRDMLWAFHSESQDILLDISSKACSRAMLWPDAKSLGIFLWLRSHDTICSQMEVIARNQYTAQEERDPVTCSLFYLALRKKRLMQSLWKQAMYHKDRSNMLKFLANDFSEPRWKSAALKNAFALMGKQRFEFAASFFLLGDSLKDCVNICLKQLADFQLAIAVARAYEGDDGPVLKFILEEHLLPLAFRSGFRRLASWAFWMLKRRDLAVRALVVPFDDLASSLPKPVQSVGNARSNDPSLAILFLHLRAWSMQTIKGSVQIPTQVEFHFVLHMARVLRWLGCHVLALELVKTWPFEPPMRAAKKPTLALDGLDENLEALSPMPFSPARMRHPSLLHRGRTYSTVLDIDASAEPSRVPSPERTFNSAPQGDLSEFKKVIKQVSAAPAEFSMDAFGF